MGLGRVHGPPLGAVEEAVAAVVVPVAKPPAWTVLLQARRQQQVGKVTAQLAQRSGLWGDPRA